MAVVRIPGVGDTLGPYQITRQIGAGGMGVVFEAVEQGLGRRVALKVLSMQLAGEAEFRSRFQREATVLARSDSPHIIQVYSHGEQDGVLYLATQYVPGGDLAARIAEEGLPTADVAIDIAAQVASALADAHAVGVVHRDVKPHNVLLRPGQGQVHAYLCDFGIARDDESSMTSKGVVAGTYAYLAPERFAGAAATPASDIYALGCLLWFLLTGRAPYDGSLAQLVYHHERSPIPQLPGASEQLNAFLRTALAKDPAARHASAAAAAAQLREIRNAGRLPTERFAAPPIPPPPATPSFPTLESPLVSRSLSSADSVGSADSADPTGAEVPATARRGPLVAVLAVLVVLLGIGGGLAWYLLGDDKPATADDDRQRSAQPDGSSRPVAGADVNGDGNDDVVLVDSSGNRTLALLADPDSDSGFAALDEWSEISYGPAKVVRGDFTGDGRADLALVEAHRVRVAASTGTGFATPQQWGVLALPSQFKITTGDFDDDGADDLAFLTGAGADEITIDVALARDGAFAAPETWASVDGWVYEDLKIGAVDVDRDGHADLVEVGRSRSGGVEIRVFRSLGHTFEGNEPWFEAPAWEWESIRPVYGDIDGDGVGDIIAVQDVGTIRLTVLRSDGSMLRQASVTDLDDLDYVGTGAAAADTNGDGVTELVLVDRTSGGARRVRYGSDGFGEPGPLVDAAFGNESTTLVGISR